MTAMGAKRPNPALGAPKAGVGSLYQSRSVCQMSAA